MLSPTSTVNTWLTSKHQLRCCRQLLNTHIACKNGTPEARLHRPAALQKLNKAQNHNITDTVVLRNCQRQTVAAEHLMYNCLCWVCRDLKPENILFQDKSPDSPIKVIDFGRKCSTLEPHSSSV